MFLYSFVPKIQVGRFSEMLLSIYQASLRHIPEESIVHSHRHEDVRPHIGTIFAYTGIGHLVPCRSYKEKQTGKYIASFKRRFMPGGK
jgi:hypothetical protein